MRRRTARPSRQCSADSGGSRKVGRSRDERWVAVTRVHQSSLQSIGDLFSRPGQQAGEADSFLSGKELVVELTSKPAASAFASCLGPGYPLLLRRPGRHSLDDRWLLRSYASHANCPGWEYPKAETYCNLKRGQPGLSSLGGIDVSGCLIR